MSDNPALKNILEALLMVSEQPLDVLQLCELITQDEPHEEFANEIRQTLQILQNDYLGRGIELVQVAGGYRFQTRIDYAEWVNRLWEDRPQKYSRAILETLTIIAYKQPVTRAEIEELRGVAVSTNIIRTLLEREWVRIAGHKEVPGRPAVYVTTTQFLDYFNLKSLTDLQPLPEVKPLENEQVSIHDTGQNLASSPESEQENTSID